MSLAMAEQKLIFQNIRGNMNNLTKKDGIFYWHGLEHELKALLSKITDEKMINIEWDDKGCHFVTTDKRELVIWHCRNNNGFLTIQYDSKNFIENVNIQHQLDKIIEENKSSFEVIVKPGTMDALRKNAEEEIKVSEYKGGTMCRCAVIPKIVDRYIPQNIQDAKRLIKRYLEGNHDPHDCLNKAIAFLEYEQHVIEDLDEIKNRRLHAEQEFNFYDRLLKRCLKEKDDQS